jgi:hypothetical protein
MEVIQNGRELLRLASPRQNHCRDNLVRVRQANRIVYVDSRPCYPEELAAHCSLFILPAADQNRWTHFRLQTHSLSEDFSARQPQASAIPKVTLTPGVSKFWKRPTRRPVPSEDAILKLSFIAVIQGSGGNAVQKLIVVNEYPQIATCIFNEAINGYSVIFTGACLKHELEKAKDYGPNSLAVTWRKVTSLDEMFELRARARPRGESERLVIGVLC